MTRDGAGITRRSVLLGLAVLPAAAACAPSAGNRNAGPDPLIALAAAARADAARAAAVVQATPALAPRLDPLRDARTRHAAALDAEIALAAGASTTPAPAPAATGDATQAALRSTLVASAQQAAAAAMTVAPARAGLVASVAACCATYAEALA